MAKKRHKKPKILGGRLIIPCISITMMLMLLGITTFFVVTGERVGRSLKENFTLSLLLDDSITNVELIALEKRIKAMPAVKQTIYISKEKATQEQAKVLGADPKEFLGASPIPASFEVFLMADYANNDSLQKILPKIQKETKILEVIYPKDLMDKVNRNLQQIGLILLFIASLLMLVSVSLINNIVRMNIQQSRFLIHTMKLVGAKWSFIRKPFLQMAFSLGIASALLAIGLLGLGLYGLIDWEPELIELLDSSVLILTAFIVLSVSLALTILCTLFSVNRYLRMRNNDVFQKS